VVVAIGGPVVGGVVDVVLDDDVVVVVVESEPPPQAANANMASSESPITDRRTARTSPEMSRRRDLLGAGQPTA
jgi:hypothetical protein